MIQNPLASPDPLHFHVFPLQEQVQALERELEHLLARRKAFELKPNLPRQGYGEVVVQPGLSQRIMKLEQSVRQARELLSQQEAQDEHMSDQLSLQLQEQWRQEQALSQKQEQVLQLVQGIRARKHEHQALQNQLVALNEQLSRHSLFLEQRVRARQVDFHETNKIEAALGQQKAIGAHLQVSLKQARDKARALDERAAELNGQLSQLAEARQKLTANQLKANAQQQSLIHSLNQEKILAEQLVNKIGQTELAILGQQSDTNQLQLGKQHLQQVLRKAGESKRSLLQQTERRAGQLQQLHRFGEWVLSL